MKLSPIRIAEVAAVVLLVAALLVWSCEKREVRAREDAEELEGDRRYQALSPEEKAARDRAADRVIRGVE